MISRRFASTLFQWRRIKPKALREECSRSTQAPITSKSRPVIAIQLRRYRSGVMFLMRIKNRFFTECMLISAGSACRLPGSTLRT